jgi:hypothetical protein
MSMSAEKERKMEDELAGVDKGKRSKSFWVDRYVMEFALLARKLRKGSAAGGVARDKYTPIIERQLAKVDAAIGLLESNPQIAQDYGESGKGIEDILEMIERKAAEMDNNETFSAAAETVRKTLPGARVNQVIRKAKRIGGIVDANDAFVDAQLWA